jgi:uncharacterized RDD family membrane protein YckC
MRKRQLFSLTIESKQGGLTVKSQELEYVGFWPRVGASLIDTLLQLAVTMPIIYVIYGRLSVPGRTFMGTGDFFISFVFPAIAVMAFWVYKSATPGKLAMSARVVDADTGTALSVKQSVIRYLGYVVSLIPFGVGFLWVAFDRRKQGWHDKMANSVVVRPSGKEAVRFQGNADWRIAPREPTA